MKRVSPDTIDKLNAFINSLPVEVRGKCSLCSKTLTHVVELAEIETGAGSAIVTRIFAERFNAGTASGYFVSGESLRL